ncbi:hypothetical protein [Streptomyces sp. SID13031]|uniref:hypothetical protein n=1 Tax=Streptomyces sp. SID13031 TaxID=2706046 RepID=UPI0013C9BD98|nr:hypothetical protein [Streptomyces sp. SID13031]NEA36373.1 hypothetical protein [Streptomyces sp. SID13031]
MAEVMGVEGRPGAARLTFALYGCGIVLVGALIYGFFLASVYSPIKPASEACHTGRAGHSQDFGGVPTTTPGTFPISSICRWPETGEELELVSRDMTVVPLVVMGAGLIVALGGVVLVRR